MHDIDVPYLHLDRVLHIGTLNPSDRGRNSGASSLEGRCLSVSLCPHAWRYIARLGGGKLMELRRKKGMFVDLTGLAESGQVPMVVEWARSERLVKDAELWKAWAYDVEAEEWRYSLEMTEEAAIDEAESSEGPDGAVSPDGGPSVSKVTVPVATWRMVELTGHRSRHDEDATDMALLAFAMKDPHADGAWWRETFDPDTLSAPRGCIFPEKVGQWKAKPIGWGQVDDEEELAEFERLRNPVPHP